MTKNDIIAQLFTSKDFNDCIGKMDPAHLQDELKSEVALILCEKSEELIVGLYERGELNYYAVRVIINLIKSTTSPFYKKFRHTALELTEVIEMSVDTEYDNRSDIAIDLIDSLYWYDREILKLYAKLGTYRKVEEETGIPFESVYKTVQRGCREIRKRVA